MNKKSLEEQKNEKVLTNMEGILGIEKKNCCGFDVCG